VEAILAHFDGNPAIAARRYADYVEDATAETTIDRELVMLLAQADRDRAILRAHLELGYTIREIADALRCHPKTVRRRLAAVVREGV
jgi:DNA-directed RNA polymerase specialized sigma24 family protein